MKLVLVVDLLIMDDVWDVMGQCQYCIDCCFGYLLFMKVVCIGKCDVFVGQVFGDIIDICVDELYLVQVWYLCEQMCGVVAEVWFQCYYDFGFVQKWFGFCY